MRLLTIVVLLTTLATSGLAADAFKVIVHPSNASKTLSRDQVSRLFLKKQTSWSGGGNVAPADLAESSPVRAAFSKAVHHKSVAEVKSYWQQQIFSGRAVPPPEKANDAAVVKFVESTPGSIGYVAADAPTGAAQVVSVE
jgi:ABC-type phosphate transport system substrate-binding protein